MFHIFDTARDTRFGLVAVALGVLIGTLGNYFYLDLFTDTRLPVQVNATWFDEATVEPGGIVHINITRLKVRDCPLTRHSFWINRSGVVVAGQVAAGGKTGSSDEEVTIGPIRLEVPASLTPRMEWGFDPVLYYYCSDRLWVIKQPIAWVQVVE